LVRPGGIDAPWSHPNSRFTSTLADVPNVAADFEDARGFRSTASSSAPARGPGAADPRHQRPCRGCPRQPHPGRGGDQRGRGCRRAAEVRPDVDAAVHVVLRGGVRRALALNPRPGHRSSRSPRTSTGSSATPRTWTQSCRSTSIAGGRRSPTRTAPGSVRRHTGTDLGSLPPHRCGPRGLGELTGHPGFGSGLGLRSHLEPRTELQALASGKSHLRFVVWYDAP